jgi:hypothetical protein
VYDRKVFHDVMKTFMDSVNGRRKKNMLQRTVVPGMVPEIVLLCSLCGRMRNNIGKWVQVGRYVEKYPYAYLSHGMCPECVELRFPQEYAAILKDKKEEKLNKSALTTESSR